MAVGSASNDARLSVAANVLPVIRRFGLLLTVLATVVLGSAEAQAADPSSDGLITIESDVQSADNVTGVVTASGNVRLVHADRGVVATSRQAQYFTKEARIVLSGDVDVVQENGNLLRADRVTYNLDDERAVATPEEGAQVFSRWQLELETTGSEQTLP
ncbi:LptA/OstA family protein [Synechococcus sp. MIT S1220]|uniref:LptA/OstA family protein n=1 Tax=Synechococcus sp. MIT S1220 TaxID=3082549 RepID=UPI0039AF0AC0